LKGENTPTYFVPPEVEIKKKGFITVTPDVNDIKLFVTDAPSK
jgi:hypothetical protein